MVQSSLVYFCYMQKSIQCAIRSSHRSKIQVQGWLRSVRAQKHRVFAAINDGLGPENLQLVFKSTPKTKGLAVNSFIQASGELVATPDRPQPVELQCRSLDLVRTCDEEYPFPARSPHDWQRARQYPQLRARLPRCAAVLRARAGLKRALQHHLDAEGYLQVDTPALTAADCEGAGDVFSVTAPATQEGDRESFFANGAHLTVSAQMHLEAIASGVTHVYTLSPGFRAERSRTRRHLAEFHMLEAELAPARRLSDLTRPLEALVLDVVARFLESCGAELPLLLPDGWQEHQASLLRLVEAPFVTMTHAEAVEVLSRRPGLSAPARPHADLSREHELALLEHTGQTPLFVTDWPAQLKPFYMRCRGDTAAAVDLLVPRVGELAGGSLREEDADLLTSRLRERGLLPGLAWYAQLRRCGGPPTAGYGLGFERLLLLLTGLEHVRDVVPFPRWYGHCSA